jgi:hypothetical protein
MLQRNIQQRDTMYSSIGKFESRKAIAEFDALLIQLYGRNMTDAHITRQEALHAMSTTDSVREAVVQLGTLRGFEISKAA